MKFTHLLGRIPMGQARYLDEISRKGPLQTSDSLHLFASPSPHLSQPWASRDLSDAADHPKGMAFFRRDRKIIEAPGMELGLP